MHPPITTSVPDARAGRTLTHTAALLTSTPPDLKARTVDGDDLGAVSETLRAALTQALAGTRPTLPLYTRYNIAAEGSQFNAWRYVPLERPATEVLELLLDCREATALQVEALVKRDDSKLLAWMADAYVEGYAQGLARAGWMS